MRISHLKVSVALLAIAGLGSPALADLSAGAAANAASGSAHRAAAIPAALRPALYQAMARNAGQSYGFGNDGCATLPKKKLAACFTNSGVHFTLPAGQGGAAPPLALHLVAWGRERATGEEDRQLTAVEAVAPTIEGNRASYAHGDLTEWWRVLPMGFEQGFTVGKQPAGEGRLTLALAASLRDADTHSIRHARAELASAKEWGGNPGKKNFLIIVPDTNSDLLQGCAGMPNKSDSNTLAWRKLPHGELFVTAANGKVIPATLMSTGDRILIADNGARPVYPLIADPLVWLEQRVTASDGTEYEFFGWSAALSGTTAFVGEPIRHNARGAVDVFNESGGVWTQTSELTASDGAIGDEFGATLALSGTTVLIGAPGKNNFQGAAYVFRKSFGSWTQAAELMASDGAAGDSFGGAVALSGTTALVGGDQFGNRGPGVAYVFKGSDGTWVQTAELSANDGTPCDLFGSSVALSGTTIFVGAPIKNNGQGVTYVFNESRGGWLQTAELAASDGIPGDQFGSSVALSGATALVGAPIKNSGQGAVYVFSEAGGVWVQAAVLMGSDSGASEGFGDSLALSGTTALVGAQFENNGQGAAYVFNGSGDSWMQTAELMASEGSMVDQFGFSVALSGTTALVGAPFKTVNHNLEQGAAYFYGESDLGLAVSAPEAVNPGQNYVNQTIATNNSSAASRAVAVTVAVPVAASFVSATASQGSCSEDSNVVTCDFGAIDGNAGTATADVTLKATGGVGATIENVAGIAKATPALTASAPTVIERGNSPPVAKDGTLTTGENTAASGTLEASDPDGDQLTFIMVDPPSHGTVMLSDASKGAYLYTPDKNYSGSDSFTFKASDGQADSNVATISITVKAAPPPPPPPSGGGGGGGSTGPLGLGLLALVGGFALWRRRKSAH